MKLEWQRPTDWSAETKDGLWYAERVGGGPRWSLSQTRPWRNVGEYPSLGDAQSKAEELAK